jgi:ABC-2 type transport system permease protein
MPEALTDTARSKLPNTADPLPIGTPSLVEESEPTVARIAGIAGVFFVAAGTFMWYWNGYVNPESPPFRPFFIRLWWVLGLTGMFAQAFRDRELYARRGYGLLGYSLVSFGLITAAVHIANTFGNPTITALVACVLGLLVVAVTAAPFVRDAGASGDVDEDFPEGLDAVKATLRGAGQFFPRWWASLKDSTPVQKSTMVGVLTAVLSIIVGYALLRMNALPHATAGLLLGFLFLLAFSNTERNSTWRDAGIFSVALVGVVSSLTAGSAIVYKPLGIEVYGLPIELALAVVGILFLGAFIGMKGTDSVAGHGMAMVLFGLGVAIGLIGLLRCFVPGIKFDPANLRVPAGFLSVTCGGIAAFVGATLAFDNRILTLTRRELSAYFYSPIAYIVLFCTVVVAWDSFRDYLGFLVPTIAGVGGQPIPEPVVAGYYINWRPIICLIFFVPAITMRLLSEENRSGTLEVLLTAPVTETTVVVSKFLAAWIFYLITWLPWIIFPLALRYMGNEQFDTRPMMSFVLGIAFMAGGFLSMGLLFSSLTRNQIIAFVLTAVGMVILTFMFFLIRSPEGESASVGRMNLLRHVSYVHHLIELVEGKIPLQYLFYHVSLTILGLFLTVKVLESRKWR